MARIRSIKPEFPQSESMGGISRDARLTFIECWSVADDAGRLRGSARMLASVLFPYDDDAPALIGVWLDELEAQQCIVRYRFARTQYVQIVNWGEHQKIDKPTPSQIPPPTESDLAASRAFADEYKAAAGRDSASAREDSASPREPLASVRGGIGLDWNGMDRKGEEGKGKGNGATASRLARAAPRASARAPKRPRAGFDPLGLSLPAWLQPSLWVQWVDHRREIRKPLTKAGAELSLKRLAEFHAQGIEPEQAIETSIASGWQGLFEPPAARSGHRGNGSARSPPQGELVESNRAAARAWAEEKKRNDGKDDE